MKNKFLIVFLLAVCSITSCKKDYTCTCYVTNSAGIQQKYQTYVKAKKKNRAKACEATAPESSYGKTCTEEDAGF
ncbi:MAG: hypothetical protein JWP12_2353 [Bacteroidetes bacterium]|nr:hypothetical protein [Bacteroidota bacterium]